jgi:UDP-N-acetyl-D-mannosaminuronic acid transferase (WecB/TagA/CpsF family)
MEIARETSELPASPYRRILGIDFFCGSAEEAVDRMRRGGLLVVPAAPALLALSYSPLYREALLQADLALTDSSFMVLTWNLMQRDHIDRLSGLVYLRRLLFEADVRLPGNTLWVMASEQSARCNLDWLRRQGVRVPEENVSIAPLYTGTIRDPELIETINRLQPQHVIITVGGGVQERLGLYLKRNLTYLPAIHCIGAAIAFLSGDQVRIPGWADKLCIGWFLRSCSEPRRYVPRYWEARHLLNLLLRYREELPPLIERRRP